MDRLYSRLLPAPYYVQVTEVTLRGPTPPPPTLFCSAMAANVALQAMQAGEVLVWGHNVETFRHIRTQQQIAWRLDTAAPDIFEPLGMLLPGLTTLSVGFTLQPQHLMQVCV